MNLLIGGKVCVAFAPLLQSVMWELCDFHVYRVPLMQWQVEFLQSETLTDCFRTWTLTASGLLFSEILWVLIKTASQILHVCNSIVGVQEKYHCFVEKTHTDCLVYVVCFRRTVSRLSFWLLLWSTSSQSSWCPSTATSWSPTMTRNILSDRSLPEAQVHSSTEEKL